VLASAGLMNDRLGVVHGVWLSPRNIAEIAEAGARVVHNPVSNLKLKSGVAPILDLYRAGIDIALGCDNCSCAETQNIFTAMRMLCLLPAVTEPDPGPINAGYALKAATLSGARAVGLGGKVGALKPGMAADLTILDLTEPAFVPFNSARPPDRFCRIRARGRDRVRRWASRGPRRQAGHLGRDEIGR
jgi:5-methylthioadenosine/S-adenosylhomocysteine deaminase